MQISKPSVRWISCAALIASCLAAASAAEPAWPAATATNKPWTRWWWLGSAVDQANITRELEAFAKAGIGGVEICPIYGAVGAEDRFIDFLSPKWMNMLAHTTSEAKRLGLIVDMTTGTGWPFGGPMVKEGMSSSSLARISATTIGGKPFSLKLPSGKLLCLRAFPESGTPLDLTEKTESGKLVWNPPPGKWTILGLASKSQIQKVKRSAPGGEGDVLDPFSPTSMDAYLAAFDKAFAGYSAPRPRAQFHDSFEYYAADWTPALLETFKSARGYDLLDQLPAFSGMGDAETIARVRADYRQTLGEMHRDYLTAWHDWANQTGGLTRNQAHGSPGNLLDHYAVADIPETEIFRHVGEEQIPMLRFAASAANATGRKLVSSETFTWLGEHFQVTPEKLKEAADFVFLGGVNHIFFHGIPYSPADAQWPGWLFYASTHMGPNGGLWRDLPTFNAYIQRCQSILQDGTPASDVLLYFPFSDLIHDGQGKLPLFTVHNQDTWLHPTPFYRAAMEMWNHGITFDYVSDDLLTRAKVENGKIMLGENSFKALVLPEAKYLEVATLQRLIDLASQGANIIVQNSLPEDVPGFHQHRERRDALLALATANKKKFQSSSREIRPALEACGVTRESMADAGLRFVRRNHPAGSNYFIVNRSGKTFDGSITTAAAFQSAMILDPWDPGKTSVVSSGPIPLLLEPGQSIIIRTFSKRSVEGKPWNPARHTVTTMPLGGPWKLEFIEGGPALPNAAELQALASWTTLPDPAAVNFSGTGRYVTSFDLTKPADSRVTLDLGKAADTARVYLNGKLAGVSWCDPRLIDLTDYLKAGRNELAIEVTNLAANRIADLDRRKIKWKSFHEINFVNIDYKPFDASAWPPLPSGLIGPVRLLVDASR